MKRYVSRWVLSLRGSIARRCTRSNPSRRLLLGDVASPPEMTTDELKAWAKRNGQALIRADELDTLCSNAFADIDREYADLCGA